MELLTADLAKIDPQRACDYALIAQAFEVAMPHGRELVLLDDYERGFTLDQSAVRQARAKLDGFADLQPGWDTDGYAPAIDTQIIKAAGELIVDLADQIAHPFYVVPTLQGGVNLEWRRGPRELELELVSPDRIEYLFTDEANGIEEEAICQVTDDAFIRGLLARVHGG